MHTTLEMLSALKLLLASTHGHSHPTFHMNFLEPPKYAIRAFIHHTLQLCSYMLYRAQAEHFPRNSLLCSAGGCTMVVWSEHWYM